MSDRRTLGSLTDAPPVAARRWIRLDGDEAFPAEGRVAEEVPVAFVYGARAHLVMMATPADLEDLATGFSVTEGIVESASDIAGIAIERHAAGV